VWAGWTTDQGVWQVVALKGVEANFLLLIVYESV
jgi:hypothetical protein